MRLGHPHDPWLHGRPKKRSRWFLNCRASLKTRHALKRRACEVREQMSAKYLPFNLKVSFVQTLFNSSLSPKGQRSISQPCLSGTCHPAACRESGPHFCVSSAYSTPDRPPPPSVSGTQGRGVCKEKRPQVFKTWSHEGPLVEPLLGVPASCCPHLTRTPTDR